MTRDEARKFAVVMAAWGAGKVIQYQNAPTNEGWIDVPHDNIAFYGDGSLYRIKPEPVARYRIGLFNGGGDEASRIGTLLHNAHPGTEGSWEKAHTFVRWLTDWVDVYE